VEYRALVDRKREADKRADARMGHLLTMVAPFVGLKRSDGLPMQMGDFFPDLASSVGRYPREINVRAFRGREEDAEEAFTRGWDRWAKISRAVASGKRRVAS
jgi:hypothetical protein